MNEDCKQSNAEFLVKLCQDDSFTCRKEAGESRLIQLQMYAMDYSSS